MEEERFNNMTDEEIVGILKAISDRYGVRYYKVGYSTDYAGYMMVCIEGSVKAYKGIVCAIHDTILKFIDIEGNPVQEEPEYEDDWCPVVTVCDTEYLDMFNRWVKYRERNGENIRWLTVE